ncbi:hypothetical protein A7X67_16195 [Clostridium sp. W14A]|nr:hypothetical protein A7X67_16195 [Clostridium sp. W14A]
MLKLKAVFERKVDRFPETVCVVERALELSKAEYREFRDHLTRDMPFIAENRDWMLIDENNVAHCLLVLGEGGSEGVLVNSEGYDYARYASLMPGARELIAVQQKQKIAEKEQASSESASLRLRDLLRLGLPENTYLVDDDYSAGFIPVGGLKDGNISDKARKRFADLLDAPIKAIRPGVYGTEIVISGVPTERLSEFDQALADNQIEAPAMGM